MNLYLDCTILKNWTGPVTGIPRVVERFSDEFKKTHINTILFYFDIETNSFLDLNTNNILIPGKYDWVFSAGPCWNYQGFLNVIESLKVNGTKYAHLYHDMIPVVFPYYYETNFDRNFKQWAIRTFALTDLAFTISNATKKDLLKVAGSESDPKKVVSVRLGDDISPAVNAAGVKNIDYPHKMDDFILCVGTIEARKNHRLLIDAMVDLVQNKKFTKNLVIVGREGWLTSNITAQLKSDPLLTDRVFHFDNLSDEDLTYLYSKCRFTVFPSFYEGWGLPVAESLKFGKPCIASNTMGVNEIEPTLTTNASPYDLQQWIDLILTYSNNEELYLTKKKSIQENYKTTSWSSTVQSILSNIIEQGN